MNTSLLSSSQHHHQVRVSHNPPHYHHPYFIFTIFTSSSSVYHHHSLHLIITIAIHTSSPPEHHYHYNLHHTYTIITSLSRDTIQRHQVSIYLLNSFPSDVIFTQSSSLSPRSISSPSTQPPRVSSPSSFSSSHHLQYHPPRHHLNYIHLLHIISLPSLFPSLSQSSSSFVTSNINKLRQGNISSISPVYSLFSY